MNTKAPLPVDGSEEDHEREQIQIITLRIGPEEFCLDILSVREIVRTGEFSVTRVPHAFSHVNGVVNLRGKVVPVVDLGRLLDMQGEERETSRLVVVEVNDAVVGFVVDSVSEVLQLDASTFVDGQSPDGYGSTATVKGKIMTLIDVAELLTIDEPSAACETREG